MGRKKINKIEKFINDNRLDFTGSGSGLNGNCVILAGYACYLELNEDDFIDLIPTVELNARSDEELRRVFRYAYDNNYDKYWETADAKSTYKF